jgi:hypothetical protein
VEIRQDYTLSLAVWRLITLDGAGEAPGRGATAVSKVTTGSSLEDSGHLRVGRGHLQMVRGHDQMVRGHEKVHHVAPKMHDQGRESHC